MIWTRTHPWHLGNFMLKIDTTDNYLGSLSNAPIQGTYLARIRNMQIYHCGIKLLIRLVAHRTRMMWLSGAPPNHVPQVPCATYTWHNRKPSLPNLPSSCITLVKNRHDHQLGRLPYDLRDLACHVD